MGTRGVPALYGGFETAVEEIGRRRGYVVQRSPDAFAGRKIFLRFTSALGGTLTALGLVAITVLVADSDSTLFLYTDRLVVAVVGLIVLIPTITLFVIGRVLVLVGDSVRQPEEEPSDD